MTYAIDYKSVDWDILRDATEVMAQTVFLCVKLSEQYGGYSYDLELCSLIVWSSELIYFNKANSFV